mgnify:CR=1 FL=1
MKKTLSRLPRVVRLAALSAVLLALCSKSSPLYAFNDWMDANIFFTMGRSMLGGRVLYRDVFDHKGPVLYLLYGLAGLVSGTDFRGVLVLEILAMTAFLYMGLRTVELLAGRRLSVWWMALPAAGLAASRAFSHGGSAEELLLPFLAAALYGLIKCLTANRQMPLHTVALQGFLCGCALLLKYTVLGFYLAWVAVLAVLYLRRGWLRQLGRSCAAYLGGLALAALPWFAYFGAHHALDAWWECYFYDNLFLYKGDGRSALTLAQHLWWAVRDDLPAVCLLAAFLLWAVLSKRCGAALATLAMAAGLAFTSLMGGYLVYYGLVLAVFAPLGLAALPQKLPAKRGVYAALSMAGIAAAAAWCLLLSPNRALRGRTAESLPQLQFAEIIRQTPNATLLNYGTLDGGFYSAAGVLPPCRYFCVTNMPLQDQWQQQWDLLDAAAVDYVVALTGDLQNDYPIYHCVASQTYNGGEGEVTWYLYQLQQ